MKRLGVFLLPPGSDASPSQGLKKRINLVWFNTTEYVLSLKIRQISASIFLLNVLTRV